MPLIMQRCLYGVPRPRFGVLNIPHIIDFWNIRHINEIFCDDAEQICKVGHIHFFSMDIFNDAQRHICADLQCCTFCTLGIHADAVTSQARYSRVVHLHVSARYSRQSSMNRQTCSCAAPQMCCSGPSACNTCLLHVRSQKSAQKRPFCQLLDIQLLWKKLFWALKPFKPTHSTLFE